MLEINYINRIASKYAFALGSFNIFLIMIFTAFVTALPLNAMSASSLDSDMTACTRWDEENPKELLALAKQINQITSFPKVDVIRNTCRNQELTQPKSEDVSLRVLVDSTFAKYDQLQPRMKDPKGFVEAIDQILLKTEFASVIKCRDRLKADKNFNFSMVFQAPDTKAPMSVNSRYEDGLDGKLLPTEVVLSVNPFKKTAKNFMFVYLHELVHVCQQFHERELEKKSRETHTDMLANADFIRAKLFGEIVAFYTQANAYKALVQVSNIFCHQKRGDDHYEGYAELIDLVQQGSFAQSFAASYLSLEWDQGGFKGLERNIIDMNKPKIDYRPFSRTDKVDPFSLSPFQPKFKKLIQDAGIPLNEEVKTSP